MGMVICMVLLSSPLSFTYFYCWLLPVWTAIAVLWNSPQLTPQARKVVHIGGVVAVLFLVSRRERADRSHAASPRRDDLGHSHALPDAGLRPLAVAERNADGSEPARAETRGVIATIPE